LIITLKKLTDTETHACIFYISHDMRIIKLIDAES